MVSMLASGLDFSISGIILLILAFGESEIHERNRGFIYMLIGWGSGR